jgi:hypothetical protein
MQARAGSHAPEAARVKPCNGSSALEAARQKPCSGGLAPEFARRKPRTGRSSPEASRRKPKAGSRKQEAESRKLKAGSRGRATGSRVPEHPGTCIGEQIFQPVKRERCSLRHSCRPQPAKSQPKRVQMQGDRMSIGNGCAKQSRALRSAPGGGRAARSSPPRRGADRRGGPVWPAGAARGGDKADTVETADQATGAAR